MSEQLKAHVEEYKKELYRCIEKAKQLKASCPNSVEIESLVQELAVSLSMGISEPAFDRLCKAKEIADTLMSVGGRLWDLIRDLEEDALTCDEVDE